MHERRWCAAYRFLELSNAARALGSLDRLSADSRSPPAAWRVSAAPSWACSWCTPASPVLGGLAMLLFSFGIAVPFLLAALGLSWILPLALKLQRATPVIGLASAAVMLFFGVSMATGQLSCREWLAVPALAARLNKWWNGRMGTDAALLRRANTYRRTDQGRSCGGAALVSGCDPPGGCTPALGAIRLHTA